VQPSTGGGSCGERRSGFHRTHKARNLLRVGSLGGYGENAMVEGRHKRNVKGGGRHGRRPGVAVSVAATL